MSSRKRKAGKEAVEESYASSEYWDQRYDSKEYHEWYYSFEDLWPIMNQVIDNSSAILEIGCGDAPLLDSLAEKGHEGRLEAIDFSSKIINNLKAAQDAAKPKAANAKRTKGTTSNTATANKVTYSEMDARKLVYVDCSFDCIVDKGTCDAMLCDPKTGTSYVSDIMCEACRTLKSDGSIIIVSHIDVDSPEFDAAFVNTIFPVLQSQGAVQWEVTVHTAVNLASVYVMRSSIRRKTRSAAFTPAPLTVKILSYDDSDEESESD